MLAGLPPEKRLNRVENRAERLKKIELILYRALKGVRSSELAEEFGVSVRTIYRDIQSLSSMGVPIWDEKGLYFLEKDNYLTMVRLNINEAVALFIAARLLSKHSDEHNPHVISALEKLSAASPDPMIRAHIGKTAEMVKGRRPNPGYIKTLEKVTRAWADKRRLRIEYCSSSGDITIRVIDPYFIEPSPVGYACYVIAYDHLREEVRTFKIERIKNAVLLNETYEIDPEFDPYTRLQNSWGDMWREGVKVRLKFSSSVSRRVRESEWHPTQSIEDCPDGGCIMTVEVGATLEMLPWIRSWGGEVEVLEPPELREVMIEETKKLMKLYGVFQLEEGDEK